MTEEVQKEIKGRVDKFLYPLVKRLIAIGITPNILTLANLASGCLAGLLLAMKQTYVSIVFIGLSLLFDGLDGALARALRIESEFGEIFDLVIDRYVMAIMFVGIAYAGYANPLLIIIALFGVFIENYAEEMIKRIKRPLFEIAVGVRPIIAMGVIVNFDLAMIFLATLYNGGGFIQIINLARVYRRELRTG